MSSAALWSYFDRQAERGFCPPKQLTQHAIEATRREQRKELT